MSPTPRCLDHGRAARVLVVGALLLGSPGIAAQGVHTVELHFLQEQEVALPSILTEFTYPGPAGGYVLVPRAAADTDSAVEVPDLLDELSAILQTLPDPERREETRERLSRGPRVWLRSGTELPAAVDLERLGTQPDDSVPLRLDQDLGATRFEILPAFVRALRTRDLEGEEANAFALALASPDETEDFVFVEHEGALRRQPVQVIGFVAGENGAELRLTFRGKEFGLALDRLAGIVFANARGAAPQPLAPPVVRLPITDGTPIEGQVDEITPTRFVVRIAEGPSLRLPRNLFPLVRVRSSKVVWLSDLEPEDEHRTPALDRVWPWTRDRAPAGAGILLDGRRHERGLVLPPRTRLGFVVPPGFSAFACRLGFDDRAGPLGHAVFRVLGDGRSLFEHTLTASDEPVEVYLELEGVRMLELETDFGERFDLGDHCAFADARLLRTDRSGK